VTMVNSGLIADSDLDAVVTDAVDRLLHGLRPR
jgi:hypothetical protein